MLRIERQQKRFTRLDQPKLAEASLTERYTTYRSLYSTAPGTFSPRLGKTFSIIGKEIPPSEVIQGFWVLTLRALRKSSLPFGTANR